MIEPVSDSDSPSPDRSDIRRELTLVRVATLLCAITTAFLLFMLVFAALAPGGFIYWPAYLLPVLHLAVLWLLRSPDGRKKGTSLARLTGGLGAVVGLVLIASRATGRISEDLAAAVMLFAPIVVVHLALAVAAGRLGAAIRGVTVGGVPRALIYAAAVVVILFMVWVAVPTNIHPAASRNESAALGDVRTVISAQAAYSSANHGYYDELTCLASPWSCIPGYPWEAPQFLGEYLATDVKDGYRRELWAGPPAVVEADEAAKISPSSIRSFAYVVIPVEPEESGYRAFCGDSDGVIRYSRDGTMPQIPDGKCPESLEELQ